MGGLNQLESRIPSACSGVQQVFPLGPANSSKCCVTACLRRQDDRLRVELDAQVGVDWFSAAIEDHRNDSLDGRVLQLVVDGNDQGREVLHVDSDVPHRALPFLVLVLLLIGNDELAASWTWR